jgi:Zn-dependent protease with chaperone function
MATHRDPIPSGEISRLAAAFDITRVRCAAEAALWAAIEKDAEFKERLLNQTGDREAAVIRGKMSLITDAYRVDPAITPQIEHLCDALRSTLGLIQPIDMYVKASPECNAFYLPSRKGTRLVMCLHSELLRLLTPRELLFVMGHEVRHALLTHTSPAH